jgi:hypothetical protein
VLLYDWRFTAYQFVLATGPLRLTTGKFIFKLNTCGYSPYVTFSLARRWVCRIQLLLILASAAILRPESRGTLDHILLSQIRDSSKLEDQVPIYISPRNRVAWLHFPALGFPLWTASQSHALVILGISFYIYIGAARTIQKTPHLLSELLCDLATSCRMAPREQSSHCCVFTGTCLPSCCLAMLWSNPLKYFNIFLPYIRLPYGFFPWNFPTIPLYTFLTLSHAQYTDVNIVIQIIKGSIHVTKLIWF